MEIDTKVNGIVHLGTDKDQMYSQMVMCFWENITTARLKDMVSTVGLTETSTVVCSLMVANKDRELGKSLVLKKIQTCMRVNITMTSNMDMESSNGQPEVTIVGNM